MSEFKEGQYVIYQNGRSFEIGRIHHRNANGNYAVAYHTGCTLASTPEDNLHPIKNDYIFGCEENLGYHVFDDECINFDPECCFQCRGKVKSE